MCMCVHVHVCVCVTHVLCNVKNKETCEITLDVHITLYVCVSATHTHTMRCEHQELFHVFLYFSHYIACACVCVCMCVHVHVCVCVCALPIISMLHVYLHHTPDDSQTHSDQSARTSSQRTPSVFSKTIIIYNR